VFAALALAFAVDLRIVLFLHDETTKNRDEMRAGLH
jgi:hypothetical protein